MKSFSLQAPAKLNLSLRVLRKREDGFHEIDTLMIKLPELADVIDFEESDQFTFKCDTPEIPSDEDNLVVKAVRAYEISSKVSCKCVISLKKLIPDGAGLGGGSSDAAATLLGLNRLHDYKLSTDQLLEIAASLGSDIPFFLISGAARCGGRGEKVTAVPSPPAMPVFLVKPSFKVPTPDAYGRWAKSQEIPGIRYIPQNIDGITLLNDLERPVFEKHRFLAEIKEWLLNRVEVSAALMSGSGSTLFAVMKNAADAEKLASAARFELDPHLWHWSGMTGC